MVRNGTAETQAKQNHKKAATEQPSSGIPAVFVIHNGRLAQTVAKPAGGGERGSVPGGVRVILKVYGIYVENGVWRGACGRTKIDIMMPRGSVISVFFNREAFEMSFWSQMGSLKSMRTEKASKAQLNSDPQEFPAVFWIQNGRQWLRRRFPKWK